MRGTPENIAIKPLYTSAETEATLVQELAFTLADGREYVRSALAKGLNVDDFAGRLSFFFAIGMNIFMEAAKLRAARLIWSRVMANSPRVTARMTDGPASTPKRRYG